MKFPVHRALAVLCAIAIGTATSSAWARRITLNDTGMTQCVGHRGSWSPDCAKSGQDAASGRDVHYPDPDDGAAGFSFRKVCRSGQMAGEGSCPSDPVLGDGPDDWGCTYDNVTQLTWETKTDDDGIHRGLRFYTNQGHKSRNDPADAGWLVDATNTEALCGATNWRLPDGHELQSLVHYGRRAPGESGPMIDLSFFPNSGSRYWTRTTYVSDRTLAWYLVAGDLEIQERSRQALARLVHITPRSAMLRNTALAKNRFIPSADGTEVTDTQTGLVWRRCTEGMEWNAATQSCDGAAIEFTWEPALDHARAQREGGWRIPNVKELFSIVDHSQLNPSLDVAAFPNTKTSLNYLSSTPVNCCDAGDISAETVWFYRGAIDLSDIYKYSERFLLRLVRRGRE